MYQEFLLIKKMKKICTMCGGKKKGAKNFICSAMWKFTMNGSKYKIFKLVLNPVIYSMNVRNEKKGVLSNTYKNSIYDPKVSRIIEGYLKKHYCIRSIFDKYIIYARFSLNDDINTVVYDEGRIFFLGNTKIYYFL